MEVVKDRIQWSLDAEDRLRGICRDFTGKVVGKLELNFCEGSKLGRRWELKINYEGREDIARELESYIQTYKGLTN